LDINLSLPIADAWWKVQELNKKKLEVIATYTTSLCKHKEFFEFSKLQEMNLEWLHPAMVKALNEGLDISWQNLVKGKVQVCSVSTFSLRDFVICLFKKSTALRHHHFLDEGQIL
jgi:hypothetical protein